MQQQFKYYLKLIFNTSIGIFLFILFFQPFGTTFKDVDHLIVFFAGFSGIVFILNSLCLIGLPAIFSKTLKIGKWEVGPPFLINALIVILNSVAFSFYLRYVGKTPINFNIVIQIVLILLSSVLILRLIFTIKYQKEHIESYKTQLNKRNDQEETGQPDTITLFSENKTEKLKLELSSLYYIKSADNYIEIFYKAHDNIEKKLLRNTLKNIEISLKDYDNFIRCHRTFIVNLNHIDKISKDYKGNYLKVSDINEEIPVSRHYLLKVQETIENLE
jgi:DNA-binding LytR/AlgR family response regulator